MSTKQLNPMLTKKDVCQKLVISLRTLNRLIDRGEIIGAKIGGQWRIRPENLERWIEKKEMA